MYYPVREDGKWGFIDTDGKYILDPVLKFDKLLPLINNRAWARREGTWRLINENGKLVEQLKFKAIGSWLGNVVPVNVKTDDSQGGGHSTYNWGLYHREKGMITDQKYDDTRDFIQNLAKFRLNGKYGFLNTDGEEVIPSMYEEAFGPFNQVIIVKDNQWGIINKDNQTILDLNFPVISLFSGEYAKIGKDGKFGIIRDTGKILFDTIFDEVRHFRNGIGWAKEGGVWSIITQSKDKYSLAIDINKVFDFNEKRAVFSNDNGFGVVNSVGEIIVYPKYTHIDKYSEGLAWMKIKQSSKNKGRNEFRFGVIDKDGEVILPPQFDFDAVMPFHENVSWITIDGKYGLIDDQGTMVIKPQYDNVRRFTQNGIAWVNLGYYADPVSLVGGKWGIIDKFGNTILDIQFDSISYLSQIKDGLGKVWKGKRFGYINRDGDLIWMEDR